MDGSIKVDSEEGKGSTFSFQIVLKKVAEEEAETEEVQFPQGRFVYEGNGRYQEEHNDAEELDNWKEIQNNMEKLLICIELENWEKAENFANIIKNLAPETEQELKKAAFRVELAIRKENKEKSLTQYDALKALVDAS